MISRYSALALLRRAVTGARWQRAWRAPEPQPTYDVVVIGGGGHGLATAYYLAANHGIRKVAVLERGYLGSGNVGRNTTIVRSNYQIDGNTQFAPAAGSFSGGTIVASFPDASATLVSDFGFSGTGLTGALG